MHVFLMMDLASSMAWLCPHMLFTFAFEELMLLAVAVDVVLFVAIGALHISHCGFDLRASMAVGLLCTFVVCNCVIQRSDCHIIRRMHPQLYVPLAVAVM